MRSYSGRTPPLDVVSGSPPRWGDMIREGPLCSRSPVPPGVPSALRPGPGPGAGARGAPEHRLQNHLHGARRRRLPRPGGGAARISFSIFVLQLVRWCARVFGVDCSIDGLFVRWTHGTAGILRPDHLLEVQPQAFILTQAFSPALPFTQAIRPPQPQGPVEIWNTLRGDRTTLPLPHPCPFL